MNSAPDLALAVIAALLVAAPSPSRAGDPAALLGRWAGAGCDGNLVIFGRDDGAVFESYFNASTRTSEHRRQFRVAEAVGVKRLPTGTPARRSDPQQINGLHRDSGADRH